jgi:hypothetical protein
LAEDDSGLDSFAETHLVGEDHSFREWRFQGENCGLNLVRIQVDGSVEQRGRETV